jgi:beta-phosphoglucomutase-like phosphatase (HAD superfamily)
MLEAVIFDMDGVLIDSEPIWQDVETELLGALGVPITRERCKETMGFRVEEAVAHWFGLHPWKGPTVHQVTEQVVDGVIAAIGRRGVAKDGVHQVLALLAGLDVRLAIASSSYYRVIDAVIARLELNGRFEVVHSAEDEERGKPDPAVYLTAAAKLAVAPDRCLAIEDSPNGVVAAKAAGMVCVAVPEPGMADDPRMSQADLVLSSLQDLDADRWAAVAGR